MKLLEKKIKGFTLIELLSSLLILSIMGYAISLMFGEVSRSSVKIRSYQRFLSEGMNVVSVMKHDIRNAFFSRTDNRFTFLFGNNRLDFHSITPDGMVEISFYYDSNNGVIYKRVQSSNVPDGDVTSGGTAAPLAGRVSKFSISVAYTDNSGNLIYIPASSNWNAGMNIYNNYTPYGVEKNPDGLPDVVKVAFTITSLCGGKPISKKFSFSVSLIENNLV